MGATNYTTNSDMLTLLALRVKEYRLAARMSQKELAEQSGVSQTTISHFWFYNKSYCGAAAAGIHDGYSGDAG